MGCSLHRGCLPVLLVATLSAGCSGNKDQGGGGLVLRTHLGLDLSQVASLVATKGTGSTTQPLEVAPPEFSSQRAALGGTGETGPQVLALTLSGEILEVALVEDPQGAGAVGQPPVEAIYPTPKWIFFVLGAIADGKLRVRLDGGTFESVGCQSVAARRSDGALFCTTLQIQGNPNMDTWYDTVRSNSSGDIVYALGTVADSNGNADHANDTIYRVSLDSASLPSAVPVTGPEVRGPLGFLVNADGDLYVDYNPSALDFSTTRCQVYPVDGGTVFTMQGAHNGHAIAGIPGTSDENTFYVGGGQSAAPGATILLVTRTGSGFIETPHPVTIANMENYGFGGLQRIGGALYAGGSSNSQMAFAKLIEDGGFVSNPTPVTISGVDHVVGGILSAASQLVFLANTGTGQKFVRFDGLAPEDIPVSSDLDISKYTVAPTGAIDFIGLRAGTHEKIHGVVAAGSQSVDVSSAGVLDPAQVVVFTRIN